MIFSGGRREAVFKFPAPQPKALTTPPQYALQVIEELAVGFKRGPQVLLCKASLPNQKKETTFVAKIFDPLYFAQPETSSIPYPPESLNKQASDSYSKEAAAYQQIQAMKQSRPVICTPDYYGSWSFEVEESLQSTTSPSVQPRRKRTICLVVIEHILGTTMEALAIGYGNRVFKNMYHRYHEGIRMAIWARFLEADSWLKDIGIDHNNLYIRNIMISPPPVIDETKLLAKEPRVLIFDFNISEVMAPSEVSFVSIGRKTRMPTNLIPKWWSGSPIPDLNHWLPFWWTEDLPQRRRWLLETFGGENAKGFHTYVSPGSPEVLSSSDKSYMEEKKGLRLRYG